MSILFNVKRAELDIIDILFASKFVRGQSDVQASIVRLGTF